ncbi:hypothetical protein TNCV_782051 [Trichonephila clavipes]|nr:hypothetical protein TNCV_782051 [Trichonephila clavipes]
MSHRRYGINSGTKSCLQLFSCHNSNTVGKELTSLQIFFNDLKKASTQLITSNYQSLEAVVSFNRKRLGGQIRESLVIRIETTRLLEDAGINGWTMANFSVMMVAVDLRPQLIERTD